jgi:hypothetical protein
MCIKILVLHLKTNFRNKYNSVCNSFQYDKYLIKYIWLCALLYLSAVSFAKLQRPHLQNKYMIYFIGGNLSNDVGEILDLELQKMEENPQKILPVRPIKQEDK